MDDSSKVAALESRFKDENGVFFGFREIERQNIDFVCAGLKVLRVGRGIFAVVYDGIDESFREDDGLYLSSQRLFQDIMLGQMYRFVGIVRRVEFGLCR